MRKVKLGNSDLKVSALGLGCMGMSEFYGAGQSDDDSVKAIVTALENGINFLDTADVYGNGHNEKLVAKALEQYKGEVIVATKFGIVKEDGKYERDISGKAEYVKQAAKASLQRLKRDSIDLYYIHRVDENVPIEETIGAMSDLVKDGIVRYIGISEANIDTIKKAHKVHPLSAVQTEYSLFTREAEDALLPELTKMGISLVAYSPLGRGFLSGNLEIQGGASDIRNMLPRFQGENLTSNQKLVDRLNIMAGELNITTSQLALAWILNNEKPIIPIPGTRKIHRILENIKAAEIKLVPDTIAELNQLFQQGNVKGARYTQEGMKGINQ